MGASKGSSTEKPIPEQKAAVGLDKEELQLRGKALARGLLLLEKYGRRRKKGLLRKFLEGPVRFIIDNNYCEADDNEYARQLAVYGVEELQRLQGIVHTHQAMSKAGSTLNTVRWMHLATFVIGNILLLGTLTIVLLIGVGAIDKSNLPLGDGNELYAALGGVGGVGVVINILYFVWVGPAVRIRRALSDTAQLEMAYKTYTMVVNNIERIGDELGVPTYAKLEKEPPSFDALGAFKEKIVYDSEKKLLSFEGIMSAGERDTLIKLSDDESYKKAIEELYLKSQLSKGKIAYLADFTKEMVKLIEERAEPKDVTPKDVATMLKEWKGLTRGTTTSSVPKSS